MDQITVPDLLALIGQKEVELTVLRAKLAEAEKKLADLTPKE